MKYINLILILLLVWWNVNLYSMSYYNRVAIEKLLMFQNFNSMYMIQEETNISPAGVWRDVKSLQALDYDYCKKILRRQ